VTAPVSPYTSRGRSRPVDVPVAGDRAPTYRNRRRSASRGTGRRKSDAGCNAPREQGQTPCANHRIYTPSAQAPTPVSGPGDTQTPSRSLPALPTAYRCWGCGQAHRRESCPYRESSCFTCGKIGHLAAFCRSGSLSDKPAKGVHQIMMDLAPPQPPATVSTPAAVGLPPDDPDFQFRPIYTVTPSAALPRDNYIPPVYIWVTLNGKPVRFEVDSGAAHTLVPLDTYLRFGRRESIEPTTQIGSVERRCDSLGRGCPH